MSDLYIKINREKIRIDKAVFAALLDLTPIHQLVAYQKALITNEISFADLKDLARRADIPYPLFLGPRNKVIAQIRDKNKNLYDKFPTKSEMQVGYRGKMKNGDIELIVKDLAKKQEILKKRILNTEPDNVFIGFVAKRIKSGFSNKQIAEDVRAYFGIDLNEMRKLAKKKIVSYLSQKVESKNIFVSLSSFNYMPQNIEKDLGLSGICVKDKKFPFIFINTRDGDEKPLILETDGRQIFTIISMIVCIGMNKFVLNSKKGKIKDASFNRMFAISGEILVPAEELEGIIIGSLDEIKELATSFKVTPSMLLFRLKEVGILKKPEADKYLLKLQTEAKLVENTPQHQPTLINGYSKYNGERFSREIIRANKKGKITPDEVKHLLFRKNKMDSTLLKEYSEKFK